MFKCKCLWPSHPPWASSHLTGARSWAGTWVFKDFSFAEASFHPSWSCSGFWLAYECLALSSASECVRRCSEFTFPGIWGREEGMGLTCLAFFLQTTQMQVSWLQVLSGLWQVMCSTVQPAAIRMQCHGWSVVKSWVCPHVCSSDCWRKVHEWYRLSVEEMPLQLLSNVCDWSQALCCAALGNVFVPFLWGGWGHWSL